MAIIDDGIGKDLHGKLGRQFTFYRRLGRTVVRSLPESYFPSAPGQVAQQCRIRSLNIFYKSVKSAGWSGCWKETKKPVGWSGFNFFASKNLPAFSAEGLIGDASKVCITANSGILLPCDLELCQEEEGWSLRWNDTMCYPEGEEEDRVMVVLMRGGRYFDLKVVDEAGVAYRKDGVARIEIPEAWREYVHLYCFMCSGSGMVSECKYFLLHY